MLKFRCSILMFALTAVTGIAAHGQALPTATQAGILQVGLGYSTSNTDLVENPNKNIAGITLYASYDLTEHISAEADVHYLSLSTPNDFEQHEYLVGPRYVFHYGRYDPYIKLQAGIGQIKLDATYVQIPQAPGSFFIYAIGGGVDVRFSHHLNLRGDLDYQKWPGYGAHGLSPYVATLGFAYRFR